MRVRFLLLPLAGILSLFAGAGSAADASLSAADASLSRQAREPAPLRTRPLRVCLYDPYRLLEGEMRKWIQGETTAAFARSGVGIRFVRAGGPEVIPATIYPELPEHWGTPAATIGVAIGAEGKRRSVFLSRGAAERAIGWRRSGDSRSAPSRAKTAAGVRQLGIALGRVLAHELTHSIAPDCPHTRTGLMAARLSRRTLTAPEAAFDELAARHLRGTAFARTPSVSAARGLLAGTNSGEPHPGQASARPPNGEPRGAR